MESQKNLPAVKGNPQEAIELIRKYKSENQLVFVSEEDLRTQSMFLPEVVIIRSTSEDFHNIQGNFMPKGYQTDRIGEAAGIHFLEENCGTRTEKVGENTVYVGFAQGKKRMPDGTWRTSSVCEYEFDPIKRAEEDFLRDKQGKYNTEKDKKLAILNYQKFGRQRANSGARLRVIRELVGIPISFKPEEIKKAMIFSRIAINTDQLLEDPEMRQVAVKIALGAQTQIYGPPKEQKMIEADYEVKNGNGDAQGGREGDAGGTQAPAPEQLPPWDEKAESVKSPEQEEIAAHLEELKQFAQIEYLHPDAKAMAQEELAKETHNLEVVVALIDRIKGWLKKYKAQQEAAQKGGQS